MSRCGVGPTEKGLTRRHEEAVGSLPRQSSPRLGVSADLGFLIPGSHRRAERLSVLIRGIGGSRGQFLKPRISRMDTDGNWSWHNDSGQARGAYWNQQNFRTTNHTNHTKESLRSRVHTASRPAELGLLFRVSFSEELAISPCADPCSWLPSDFGAHRGAWCGIDRWGFSSPFDPAP